MRPYSGSKASPISSWIAFVWNGKSIMSVPESVLKLRSKSVIRANPSHRPLVGNVVL